MNNQDIDAVITKFENGLPKQYGVHKNVTNSPPKRSTGIYTELPESDNWIKASFVITSQNHGNADLGEIDIYLLLETNYVYFHWISVEEQFQQNGHGKQLCTTAVDAITSCIDSPKIYVHPATNVSISLFSSIGFTKTNASPKGSISNWYTYP